MACSWRVSLTFLHTHLGWIFSPIWVLTFRPTGAFVERMLDTQMHEHCATHTMGIWFWTKGHGKKVLSFCLERNCESKLLVVRSWSMTMSLKRLASERRSAVTSFVHFPSWSRCLVLLFHFDDDFRLQRICKFVLGQAGNLVSFWT